MGTLSLLHRVLTHFSLLKKDIVVQWFYVMWHRGSCVSFALYKYSVHLSGVTSCLQTMSGGLSLTFGCLRCCLETTWLKISFSQLIVSLWFCAFWTLGFFCKWDFFNFTSWLWMLLLAMDYGFSPLFNFVLFLFSSDTCTYLYHSILFPLNISIFVLNFHFCDVISAGHYYF